MDFESAKRHISTSISTKQQPSPAIVDNLQEGLFGDEAARKNIIRLPS